MSIYMIFSFTIKDSNKQNFLLYHFMNALIDWTIAAECVNAIMFVEYSN